MAAEFGDGFDKIYLRFRERLPQRVKIPLETPEKNNDTWSMDFVSDKIEAEKPGAQCLGRF